MMTEATYAALMRQGCEAERRGELETAYRLFDLALQISMEDGGAPLGALLKRGMVADKIVPSDATIH